MANKSGEWYPSGRQNQINFLKRWMSFFTAPAKVEGNENGAIKNWQNLGIPEKDFRAFATAFCNAETALDAVILSGLREGPLHKTAQETFAELERQSRLLKRRFLLSELLSPAELDELGLRAPDTKRTPRPEPRHTVSARVSNPDPHVIQLDIISGVSGDEDVSHFSYNIRVGILSSDGKIPERSDSAKYYMTKVPVIPEDLPGQFNRNRRKEFIRLNAADAGKTAYFSICYQNGKGETGPWSPVFTAIIT